MNLSPTSAKSIFLEALANHCASSWGSFLDEACGGNSELRRHVEALLRAHQQHDSLFDDAPAPTYAGVARLGDLVDRYKLLEILGEGGFGVVFIAEQQEPLRRRVALKVVKPGMNTREVLARFAAERQTLAMLDHPNIARILDAGTTGAGLPYFVMELVRGASITEYCDANQLSTRERLELFSTVCEAIHYAHRKGVIHRDIKPTNVLVTLHEGLACPKIIDFGVAKAFEGRRSGDGELTRLGEMIGTPLYMSPEQAGLDGSDVDTRSDVYSLGVLLYELLTGTTPFDRKRLKHAALDEIRRVICEEEPLPPSSQVGSPKTTSRDVSTRVTATLPQLSVTLKGELDWIALKALEKDRNRRYDGAHAFAEDVRRFLNNEAVLACPPSALYRLRKSLRKHWLHVASGGIVALALLAAAGFAGLAYATHRRGVVERQIVDLDCEVQEAQAASDHATAARKLRTLVDWQRSAYGRESQPALSTQTQLGRVLRELREYEQSYDVYDSVLTQQLGIVGPSHPAARTAIDDLYSLSVGAAADLLASSDVFAQRRAISFAQRAIALAEEHNLDRALRPRDRRVGQAYRLLVTALYRTAEYDRCHDVANHMLRLPIVVTDYTLFLHLALLNWRNGKVALAKDWVEAAEQIWIGGKSAELVSLRPLRDEAVARIYGSADVVLPQQSTAEEEAVYTRILAQYPHAAGIRQKRGYCRIQLGAWDDAAADFAEAVEQLRPDGNTYLYASHALLSLHQNRLDDYRLQCQWLIARLEDRKFHPDQRKLAVIICVASPSAQVDYEAVFALAKAEPFAKGLAAYRCGKYQLALDFLKPKSDDRHLALRRLFQAMAHQRLGEFAEASEALAEARALIAQGSPRPGHAKEDPDVSYFTSVIWCEALAVLEEAEELIDSASPQVR